MSFKCRSRFLFKLCSRMRLCMFECCCHILMNSCTLTVAFDAPHNCMHFLCIYKYRFKLSTHFSIITTTKFEGLCCLGISMCSLPVPFFGDEPLLLQCVGTALLRDHWKINHCRQDYSVFLWTFFSPYTVCQIFLSFLSANTTYFF